MEHWCLGKKQTNPHKYRWTMTGCLWQNSVSSSNRLWWKTGHDRGSRGSFSAKVELWQASTQSEFNGQHKAGLLPLSYRPPARPRPLWSHGGNRGKQVQRSIHEQHRFLSIHRVFVPDTLNWRSFADGKWNVFSFRMEVQLLCICWLQPNVLFTLSEYLHFTIPQLKTKLFWTAPLHLG